MVWPFTYLVLPPPSGELSEDVEAASETTTDQEDQTKDRESGGEKELTKGPGKAEIHTHLGFTVTRDTRPSTPEWCFCLTNHIWRQHWQHFNRETLISLHCCNTSRPQAGWMLRPITFNKDELSQVMWHRFCVCVVKRSGALSVQSHSTEPCVCAEPQPCCTHTHTHTQHLPVL